MLDANLKQQLQAYLGRMTQPIEIVATLDDGDAAREMRELLEDVAGLSSLITLEERAADGSVRAPSFSVNRVGAEMGIRFAGIPMGHEFTSLVLALLQAGGHPPKVDASVVEAIQALEGPLDFEVYISLSCQNCPEVVQAINLMAVLDTNAAARQAEALKTKAPFDVLIVGGGPAGASAAVYAARKGIRTGVVTERFGGQVLDTMGIENFISVKETEGPKLAAALENHVKTYDVDIMNLQRAVELKPADASGLVSVKLASGAELKSRSVILSTGARWREMNVPGEREYRGKGVAYCPHCDGPLFKGKRVAVIGGGNSGVEAAIDLAGIVAHVTLIEFDGQLRADEVLQRKLRSLPNVRVVVAAQTTEVHGAGGKVNGLSYRDRATGELHRLDLEGVFVQIGLLPNTEWLKGAIALSPRGEIEVDARGQTSMPGVFAAGDATTVPYKQIIIAMGEGSKAALGAFDHLIRASAPAAAAVAA
jgi:alkyl hydroperoxide reductase subunit F